MKKTKVFNLRKENELYKQKAYLLTSDKKYREVIACYEQIAKNTKIEKRAEVDKKKKSLLKYRIKNVKELIKSLKFLVNKLDECFLDDKTFFFKGFQDRFYLLEDFDPIEEFEQEGLEQIIEKESILTPKKHCYACKCKITFEDMIIANPTVDREHLEDLVKSPYIEFYCCDCLETKHPYSLVREIIRYLNLLEKNVIYPLYTIWNFKISEFQEDKLMYYLKEVAKIKIDYPNDFTQDPILISLLKELTPDFNIEESTITIKKSVLYHKFKDYEKVIVFIARQSPFFDEFVDEDKSVLIPKRFKTSNYSKAKRIFYKKKRWRNKYFLTSLGVDKFFQVSNQIEQEIDRCLLLSNEIRMSE